MSSKRHPASQAYELHPPNDALGLNCGTDGPKLGPISLLIKTGAGHAPRPADELDFVFSKALGQPSSSAAISPRLKLIAAALDQGDLARAMIITQQMRLPPLTETQAARAVEAEALTKAAFNAAQLRWPKGSPNRAGGRFAPDDQQQIYQAPELKIGEQAAVKGLRRAIVRRAIKTGLRYFLKPSNLSREAFEAVADEIPGLDVAGGIMTAQDAVKAAAEVNDLTKETHAALEFVEQGPKDLDAIKMPSRGKTFSSFDAFKKIDDQHSALEKEYGAPPPGWEYHHIIEQIAGDAKLPPGYLNSVDNIVLIPKLLHEEVTARFASIVTKDGVRMTLRNSLRGESFEKHYHEGVEALRSVGIIK